MCDSKAKHCVALWLDVSYRKSLNHLKTKNNLHNTRKMKGYPANYVCAICSQTFTRRGSCERHIIENNLDPAASVRFVDYLVGRLSGRAQPGNPSLHRRERRDKKSQINDTFFWKKAEELKMQRSFLHDSPHVSASLYLLPSWSEEMRNIDRKAWYNMCNYPRDFP